MKILNTILLSMVAVAAMGQNCEPIKFGDFDSWIVRNIKESGIIGGNTRTLYEVGPSQTIDGAVPYTNKGGSPWGTSNIYAKVSGITKTNTTVFREPRGNGFCAKLETVLQKVKVLGIINIKVLAAGSVFLGETIEPIKDTKNPMAKIRAGMPFMRRPKALVVDYKVKLTDEPNRIYESMSSRREVKGMDMPDIILVLQKRWEDEEGNIHALRVGTMFHRFTKSTDDWVNGARFTIHYGDITKESYYKSYMGLIQGEETKYAINSKGKNVKILEEGWADADTTPTHMILQFDSSYGGAYVGTIGTTLWIDNVKLEY
ncbi:MAG: PCMD domain-containing protein [Bacteroidaceae bacterium]|nr:PCMD domain-containing protein [Bacteroidaceae bacterium]